MFDKGGGWRRSGGRGEAEIGQETETAPTRRNRKPLVTETVLMRFGGSMQKIGTVPTGQQCHHRRLTEQGGNGGAFIGRQKGMTEILYGTVVTAAMVTAESQPAQ